MTDVHSGKEMRSLDQVMADLERLANEGEVLNASLVVRTPSFQVIKREFDAPGANLAPVA